MLKSKITIELKNGEVKELSLLAINCEPSENFKDFRILEIP